MERHEPYAGIPLGTAKRERALRIRSLFLEMLRIVAASVVLTIVAFQPYHYSFYSKQTFF